MAFSRIKSLRAIKKEYIAYKGKFKTSRKKKYLFKMKTKAAIYNINKFWWQKRLPY